MSKPKRKAKASQPASSDASLQADAPRRRSAKGPKVKWSDEDESCLIQYIFDHLYESGDGTNFKATTWTAAATEVQKVTTSGAPKSGESCKDKWQRLKSTYNVVNTLSQQSGFSWDPEKGTNLDARGKEVWEAYIQKNPHAKPFHHQGWRHYHMMRDILPSKAKGTFEADPLVRDQAVPPNVSTQDSDSPNEDAVAHRQDEFSKDNDTVMHSRDEGRHPQGPPSSPPPLSPLRGAMPSSAIAGTSLAGLSASHSQSRTPTSGASSRGGTPGSSVSARKRKHADLSNTSSGVSPGTSIFTAASSKKNRTNAVDPTIAVLQGFNGFSDTIKSLTKILVEGTPTPAAPKTPPRAAKLQEARTLLYQETAFDEDQICALSDLFQEEPDTVETYLSFPVDRLRLTWLRRRLAKMGFPDNFKDLFPSLQRDSHWDHELGRPGFDTDVAAAATATTTAMATAITTAATTAITAAAVTATATTAPTATATAITAAVAATTTTAAARVGAARDSFGLGAGSKM